MGLFDGLEERASDSDASSSRILGEIERVWDGNREFLDGEVPRWVEVVARFRLRDAPSLRARASDANTDEDVVDEVVAPIPGANAGEGAERDADEESRAARFRRAGSFSRMLRNVMPCGVTAEEDTTADTDGKGGEGPVSGSDSDGGKMTPDPSVVSSYFWRAASGPSNPEDGGVDGLEASDSNEFRPSDSPCDSTTSSTKDATSSSFSLSSPASPVTPEVGHAKAGAEWL